jgi:hypothetical protein
MNTNTILVRKLYYAALTGTLHKSSYLETVRLQTDERNIFVQKRGAKFVPGTYLLTGCDADHSPPSSAEVKNE